MRISRLTAISTTAALIGAALVVAPAASASAISSYSDVVVADSPLTYWRLGDTCTTFPCVMDDAMDQVDGSVSETTVLGMPALTNMVGTDTATKWAPITSPTTWFEPSTVPVSGTGDGTLQPDEFTFETWLQDPQATTTTIAQLYDNADPSGDRGGWSLVFRQDAYNEVDACVQTGTGFFDKTCLYGVHFPDDDLPHYVALTVTDEQLRLTVDATTFVSDTGGTIHYPSSGRLELGGSEGTLIMDEVAFYDSPLAKADRLEHWGIGKGASGSKADPRTKAGAGLASVGDAEDPVNTYTGSFTDEAADLTFPGAEGLEWARYYDSGGIAGPARWRYSFSDRITETAGTAELQLPTGRVIVFEPDGSGGYEKAPEFDGVLTSTSPGWELSFTDGHVDVFDGSGVLQSRTFWDGESILLDYDLGGDLDTITSSAGPSIELDGASSFGEIPDAVTASDGREVDYSFDLNQSLATVTLPGSLVWTYHNDSSGRIEAVEDPTSVIRVTNTYDSLGRVATQSTAGAGETDFTYDTANRAVEVLDVESSTAVTYTYDADGRLVSIEDPYSELVSRDYNADDYLTATTSRGGGETEIVRNADNLPTEVTIPGKGTTEVAYDGWNRVTSVTDPQGETTYSYEGSERIPSSVTDPLSHTTTLDVVDGLVESSTDADGVTVAYRYNVNRQIEEVEDEYGNITSYTYDDAGRRVSTELPSGAESTVDYDSAGREWKRTAGDGGVNTTLYDDAGRPTSITDPTNATTIYVYDNDTGLLESKTDPASHTTNYDYDVLGNLIKTTYADTTDTQTSFGPLHRAETTIDELGRETTYTYDADGNVTSTENPAGGTVTTEYDDAGRATSVTDADGRETTYDYDDDTGLLTSETSPAGTTSFEYDDLGRQTKLTDVLGGETTTAYTPAGRVASVTDAAGLVTTYAYDNGGRLHTVTAPGSHVTTYDYDDDGHVNSVTTPEGNVTTTTYDEVGQVLTVTDPAGVVTTNSWSLRGELLTKGTSGAGTIEYSYNPDGTLAWVEDALNNRTTFVYDDRGREISRTDADSKVWASAWDDAGELASTTDPLNRTTSYTYDDAGREATVADPSGRTRTNTWTPGGLLDGWSATDGTHTLANDITYDTAGRRSAATLGGRTWNYTHDAAGNLTGQTDPDGRVQSWMYDLAGRHTQVRRPNGSGVAYTYDSSGRVDKLTPTETFADSFTQPTGTLPDGNTWLSVIGARATMAASSNALHMTVGAPNGSTATLQGKAAATGGGDMTLTYQWDSSSTPTPLRIYHAYTSDNQTYRVQLTSNSSTATIYKTLGGTTTSLGTFTVPVDTNAHRIRFQQNGSALKAKVWNVGSAEPSTWTASVTDSSGPLANGTTRIQVASGSGANNGVTIDDVSYTDLSNPPTALVDYSWDGDGRLTGEDLPGTSVRSWAWTDGQLTGMTQTAPGVTRQAANTLSYDSSGRLTSISHGSGLGEAWTYDNANQVLSESVDGGATKTWTYDDLGRRATETVSGNTTTNTYDDAGELTVTHPPSGSNATYSYDAAGRRTSETPLGGGTVTYAYNPAGQLSTYTAASGESQTRSYDPDGSPDTMTNTVSSVVTNWMIDWDHTSGLAEIAGITDQASSGNTTVTSTMARADSSAPWAIGSRGPTAYALGSDALGSTLTTTGNNIARSTQYDTWGVPAGSGTLNPKLGFRGEITAKNLVQMRARDYQPVTGQFLTTDPLRGHPGTPASSSPYHYSDNDPVGRSDPTGMQSTDAIFASYLDDGRSNDFYDQFKPWHRSAQVALCALISRCVPIDYRDGGSLEVPITEGGRKQKPGFEGQDFGFYNGQADVADFYDNGDGLHDPHHVWEVKYFSVNGIRYGLDQLNNYVRYNPYRANEIERGGLRAPTLTRTGKDWVFAFSVRDSGLRLYFPLKWIGILDGRDNRRSIFDQNVSKADMDVAFSEAGQKPIRLPLETQSPLNVPLIFPGGQPVFA